MNTSETASSSDPERPNFENLKYDIVVNSDDILLDNSCDPDVNFFSLKIQNLDTPYILPEEFQKFVGSSSHDSFSILHLNIRSIKKNFDNFKLFFFKSSPFFQCDLFFQNMAGWSWQHQVRDDRKGGGVSIYIHNSLTFKVHSNLCINSIDIESLSIEWVSVSVSVFYHILTNSFADRNFKTAIFKSDVSDHFPICFIIRSTKPKIENKTSFIFKRIFNFETINSFKQDLYKTNWKDIEAFTDPNEAYKAFLESFLLLYDKNVSIKKNQNSSKGFGKSMDTNGIKKSAKKKQRLCQKFLKTRTEKNEPEYKNYKKKLLE